MVRIPGPIRWPICAVLQFPEPANREQRSPLRQLPADLTRTLLTAKQRSFLIARHSVDSGCRHFVRWPASSRSDSAQTRSLIVKTELRGREWVGKEPQTLPLGRFSLVQQLELSFFVFGEQREYRIQFCIPPARSLMFKPIASARARNNGQRSCPRPLNSINTHIV